MTDDTRGGATIAPVSADMRHALAMVALKGRLQVAIRAGRTDTMALHSARGWAEKAGHKKRLTTMKQALAWVLTQQPQRPNLGQEEGDA